MKMKRKTKGRLLQGSALALNVGAPLITTITQFPAWVERSASSTVSGVFVVFAILSAIPLFKFCRHLFKSPSVPLVWTVAAALLFWLRDIIDEMIVICLVGAISNYVGMAMYKFGERLVGKEEK